MKLKEAAIRGTYWTGLNSAIAAIVQILKLSILARLITKEDFGLMAIILLIINFINIFIDLGVTAAILHKKDISKKEYNSLYWLNWIISIIFFLILISTSNVISSFYNAPELSVLIPITASNLIITSIGKTYRIIEQKKMNFKYIALIEIFAILTSFVISIILALNGYGIYSLVYSFLLQSLIISILFFIVGQKKCPLKLHYKHKEVKPFLSIGLYQTGSMITNYFSREFDILIIGKLLGTEVLGLYSLAKQLVLKPLYIINPIITKISTPLLAKLQNDEKMLKSAYLKIINLLSTSNFMVYCILAALSQSIILLIYGDEYIEAARIVTLLSIAYAFRSIENPVGALVIAKGRTDIEFSWNITLFFIYPIVIYLSTQRGIYFLASVLAAFRIFLIFPGWFFLIQRLINISFFEYFSSFFKSFIFSIISGTIAYFTLHYMQLNSVFANLITGGGIITIFYLTFNLKNILNILNTLSQKE